MGAPDRRPPAPGAEGGVSVGGAGELRALARVLARLPAARLALVGPGDDAAVVAAPDGRFVVTTDMMLEGPDFRLAWHAPFELGWKAAATNLADVAAMGAVPTALTVGLACPPGLSVSFLEDFADGLVAACAAMAPGCGIVGGDLSAARDLTIAVTAIGDLEGRAPVLRSGARPGDVVAVCGGLGLAAAGLSLLFARSADADGVATSDGVAQLWAQEPDLLAAQLAPSPPISAGPLAARAGASAMLDVSDGLLVDAWRIAQASGVVLDLDAEALGPESEAALHGGEDHALLATFPPGAALPAGFRVLGRVLAPATDGPGVRVAGEPAAPSGWDPYADPRASAYDGSRASTSGPANQSDVSP